MCSHGVLCNYDPACETCCDQRYNAWVKAGSPTEHVRLGNDNG